MWAILEAGAKFGLRKYENLSELKIRSLKLNSKSFFGGRFNHKKWANFKIGQMLYDI